MIKGLIGKKLGMTRVFGPFGRTFPVTVIEVGPCQVVQKKTSDKDGYEAVQLGFEGIEDRKVNKPRSGHFDAAGTDKYRYLREFRVESAEEFEVGQELTADMFKVGDMIHVTGTSKGRGFAGTIKRHGFARGPETHGNTTHRAPGSIGCSAWPSRVFKGKKMPGQYGNSKATVKNLKIVDVRLKDNVILVRGGVPGPKNGLVILNKSDYR